jgi:hypothetical protein
MQQIKKQLQKKLRQKNRQQKLKSFINKINQRTAVRQSFLLWNMK